MTDPFNAKNRATLANELRMVPVSRLFQDAHMLAAALEMPATSEEHFMVRRAVAALLSIAIAYEQRDELSPSVVPDERGLRQALHCNLADILERHGYAEPECAIDHAALEAR